MGFVGAFAGKTISFFYYNIEAIYLALVVADLTRLFELLV